MRVSHKQFGLTCPFLNNPRSPNRAVVERFAGGRSRREYWGRSGSTSATDVGNLDPGRRRGSVGFAAAELGTFGRVSVRARTPDLGQARVQPALPIGRAEQRAQVVSASREQAR